MGTVQKVRAPAKSTWSAPALPGSVAFFRTAVFDFADNAGVLDPPLGNLRLAVSEAVSNAVMHAYRNDVVIGSVDVSADLGEHELRVVVVDHGAGFASRTDSPGGGFGVLLMREMADDVEIRAVAPRGTAVHMSFKVNRMRLVDA